jgi:16S rRNA (guanine527-N7)-methyltransferase
MKLENALIETLRQQWISSLPEEENSFPEILKLFTLLLETNLKVNLFSRKLSPELVFQDQFIDCALGLPYFDESAKVLDFGCGGGLPGAILAVCRPIKEFVLLDKSAKKIHYLEKVCTQMELENVTLSTESSAELYQNVDTLTSRAVAPAAKIIDLAEPHFSDRDHRYLFYKARLENIELELIELPQGFEAKVHIVPFPDNLRERHMVEIIPVQV